MIMGSFVRSMWSTEQEWSKPKDNKTTSIKQERNKETRLYLWQF